MTCVQRGQKPFSDRFTQEPINRVGQLFNNKTGHMLTYSEYKQIYSGNLSLLEFNSLKLAVQTVWKHNIKENYIELANTQKVKDIDNQIQGITKKAYWKLISKLVRTDGGKI